MSSAEIRQKIESIKSSSSKEMYEEKAHKFVLSNADGDFKNEIYGLMEPTALLEYINDVHPSKRDEIERMEKVKKFDASRMLLRYVFSLENGFFDLLNGILSFGQIRLAKKIMESIQSYIGSFLSYPTARIKSLIQTPEFLNVISALEKMPVDEFQKFVGKLFPRLRMDEDGGVVGVAGEDSFAIHRVLTIGCFNSYRRLDGDEVMRKKQIFLDQLRSHLQQLFAGCVGGKTYDDRPQHQKQIMVDIMEFHEAAVRREIKEQLKDVNFWFYYRSGDSLRVAAHREAFSHLLKHFTTKVKMLRLDIMYWKDEEIRRLFQSIQSSTVKIEWMAIWMHTKRQFDVLDHVIASLPHFTRELMLVLFSCGCCSDDGNRRFCRKLKEEINNFDTSKLQTQMLEVKVYNTFSTVLLHVELHRGKSPRIIESEY